MNDGKKSLEDITAVLEKRGWRLYEEGIPRKRGRRTIYEKAVEELESNASTLRPVLKGAHEKPKDILHQIMKLQNHLDEKVAANKGGYAGFSYNTKQALSLIPNPFSFRKAEDSLYKKSDIEIITSQRGLAKALLKEMKKAKDEMGRSYGILEEYRLETSKDLHRQTRRYMRLEKELMRLENDENFLKQKMSCVTAESDLYAELVHSEGNVKLEKQKLVNDYENTADAIMNNKISIEELTDYALVVQESEQFLGDACNSLEQVSTQQAIVQVVLSSYAKEEGSLSVAHEFMETLSRNIATTNSTIIGAFESMNLLAAKLKTGKARSGSTIEASRGLYGSLRNSRRTQTQDAHQYARQLFETPMAELAGISHNGHNPADALPE